jgi:hypothetical protein
VEGRQEAQKAVSTGCTGCSLSGQRPVPWPLDLLRILLKGKDQAAKAVVSGTRVGVEKNYQVRC